MRESENARKRACEKARMRESEKARMRESEKATMVGRIEITKIATRLRERGSEGE